MDHPDISCILYMWHARAENFSRNIGRNTTLWRIPANDNGYTTSYIYKSRFLSNRRKPHACLITLIHREFLSPCYKYFIFLHWQLKTSRMLASPFLIVKFVSRQVERLPSLKSKSYSFRGQTKSLFGSIYRTNSHLEACSTHSRNNTFRCFNLCSREFSPRSTVYLKTSLVLSFDPCTKYLLLRSPFLGSINSRETCPRVI